MRKVLNISLFLSLAVLFSCEEFEIVTCDNCLYDEPVKANLVITVNTIQETLLQWEVTVYKGKVEDGIIINNFYTSYSSTIKVNLDTEYTVTASVTIDGKTYISTDSAVPHVKVYNGCDEICYYIDDDHVNLKLKNF